MLQYVLPDGRSVKCEVLEVCRVIHSAGGFTDAACAVHVCNGGKNDSDGFCSHCLLQSHGIK